MMEQENMTEHSIDELKRQMDAAQSKSSAANASLRQAEERWQAAMIFDANEGMKARGINLGDKVSVLARGGGVAFFVGHTFGYILLRVDLRKVKKDGTMSSTRFYCDYDAKIEPIQGDV